jgi:hypothetical protein
MNITISNPMTSADLEQYLARVSGNDILNINLTGNPRWRFLAESSLLSLLMQAASLHSKVFVHLKSVQRGQFPDAVRRQLTETVPGLLLGRFTDDLFDAEGKPLKSMVRTAQNDALNSSRGIVNSGHEASAVAIDDFLAPSPARIFAPKTLDSTRQIEELVQKVVGHDPPRFAQARYVWHFVNELVQNTRDHALKSPDGRPISGARFLTVRRINASMRAAEWYETADTPFVDYLRELNDDSADFVELTVADSGIGVPARLAGRLDVYKGSIAEEVELLARAFRNGESSKPASVAGRGLGFSNVLRAVKALSGMLSIRTGRLLKYKHFASTATHNVPATVVERQLIRGTTVSILVPWRSIRA